jgi:single-stranded DNA-binding protein
VHVNVCTLVGRVSQAGPKLSYASSGTPVCSLVVEVDELGPGEKVYTTYLPVRISGRYAEQTSVDLEAGDVVQISGKLKYESLVDAKTQQKTSKLVISSWGIQQREKLTTLPQDETSPQIDSTEPVEVDAHHEAQERLPSHKGKPRYPKHLKQPWMASRVADN